MKKLPFVYAFFLGFWAIILFCDNRQAAYGHGYASSGDGLCGDCHAPTSLGSVTLSGLPALPNKIEAGKSYTLTVQITRFPNNNAPGAGFQMSAIKADGTTAGEYSNLPTDTQSESHQRCQNPHPEPIFGNNCDPNAPTITYFEHMQNADILFNGNNPIVRQVTWTAPSEPTTVVFTIAAVLTDGDFGLTDGDDYVFQSFSRQVVYPPVVISISHSDVTCPGGNDGAAFAMATGGNGNYSYNWSNGETASDIYNLTAGTYSVTVTSGAGLTSTASVQILQPPAMFLNASPANTTCPGGSNGSIILTSSGGASPYTYLWSNGATTKNILNLAAGTYTVTVTDANGCPKTTSATVAGPPAFNLPAAVTNVTCFGLNNGAINLNPGGGTPPYSYLWTNGATTQDISNLSPGAYTVTVTDSKGCSKSSSFAVSEPSTLVLIDTIANATCFGFNNGSINLTPGGGTPAYTYLWSNDSTTQDIANLSAGTYSVIVTDMNNCTKTDTITVTQPSAVSLTAMASNATCFGLNNGSIDLTPVGGVPGYAYLWSNDSTTQDIANLSAGTYSVVVTDMNNCTQTDTVTVTQPFAVSVTALVSNVTCFDLSNGSIDMTPVGGVPGYTYLWSNGSTTQDVAGLTAGSYSVTVTDMSNCTKTETLSVAQPSAVSVTAAVSNATCIGLNNGSVDLTPGGGTPGYTYLWSNDSTTQDIQNLAAGAYIVIVTDMNNCTKTDTVTVTQPTAIALTTTTSNVSCFGFNNGSIDLTPAGGTPGYTYLWSNGATTQDVGNLAAGTYSVTITDLNNCTKSIEASVTQPPPVSMTFTILNVTCFGLVNGSINLTPGGGTPGYTYLWSNGATTQDIANLTAGTYSVTVTDLQNCTNTSTVMVLQPLPVSLSITTSNATCFGLNDGFISIVPAGGTPDYTYLWSNGSTGQNNANLTAGTYSVTVTDMNNCTKTGSAVISQPSEVDLSAVVTNASCFDLDNGSINLTSSGGTPGYTYLWSNGAVTQDISNLKAGAYTVTITDFANCVREKTFTVAGPPELVLQPTIINISCFASPTGGILLEVSGGTAPYSYLWSNGDTTQHLSGVSVGLYSVTITDANNCTATVSGNIVQAPPMSLELAPEPVDCFGAASGSILTAVSGGAGVYSFLWSNGATTPDLVNVPAGLYTCTVTDAAGCTTVDSATVEQPVSALDITLDSIAPASSGISIDGAIFITTNGGIPPYSFTWISDSDTISITDDLLNVSAGAYQLHVTDANGCIDTLEIINIPIPTAEIDAALFFTLYPNPNDGRFTIEAALEVDAEIFVRIVGASGKDCFSSTLTTNELKNGFYLNVENLPAGVYFLQLWTSEMIVGRRLLALNKK